MGARSRQSNRGTTEKGQAGAGDAGSRGKRAEDANRICSIINENAENKGLSLVEAEMGKLMHQDEQELLSVWKGWHWDDNKGGWLDPELCAKA